MRKEMFWGIILALLVVVSACEKPILDGGQTKKKGFRVSVTVGVGEKAVAGAKSRALVDIDEVCSCLNAAVYKDGVKQNVINQKKGDKNFGILNFSLPEGDYLLVVIGHSGTKNVSLAHADKVKFEGGLTDTFLYHESLHVNSNMETSITLERCVAKVEFHVDDPIPEKITHLRFTYTGGSSTLDATQGVGCVNSHQTEVRTIENAAHQAASSFSIYTFPKAQEGKLKVTMTALGANETILAEHTFTALKIVKNGINHVRGLTFSSGGQPTARGIKVKVEDAWAVSFDTIDWD